MSNKRKKGESLVLGQILEEIAAEIGASVLVEPEWKIAGQITFKNGDKSYFFKLRMNLVCDIN